MDVSESESSDGEGTVLAEAKLSSAAVSGSGGCCCLRRAYSNGIRGKGMSGTVVLLLRARCFGGRGGGAPVPAVEVEVDAVGEGDEVVGVGGGGGRPVARDEGGGSKSGAKSRKRRKCRLRSTASCVKAGLATTEAGPSPKNLGATGWNVERP